MIVNASGFRQASS